MKSIFRTSGLGALAAALAMLAMPVDTMAQDGRGGGRGNQSVQSQSGGGWSGGRGLRSGGGGGERTAQSTGDGQRGWSGNRGVNDGRNNGGGWRGRSGGAEQGRNWSNSDRDGSGQRWRGGGNVAGADNSAQRAARIAEIERRRGAGMVASGQPQWSGRNRSYSDPDRNRNYRGDNLRGDPGRWNRRDDNLRGDPGRWTRRDENWRGDPGRWNGNDNRNWRGNGSRWANDGSRRWNRDWRRDNRYDWYSYRNHNRNVFRLGRYYSPYRNYSYRRLSAGFYLDSLFFGSRYWIDDPWSYRLPAAEGPYRWIRYYDDALLVDIHTGEVIDVINDFFW